MENLMDVVLAKQGHLSAVCLREDANTFYMFFPESRWKMGNAFPAVEVLHTGPVILPEGKREIISIEPLVGVDFDALSNKLKFLLKEHGCIMTAKVISGIRYRLRGQDSG